MTRKSLLLFLVWCIFCGGASADRCDRALRRLEGWTILDTTSIDGDFEGCDFGRKIRMINGDVYTCSEYSYTYSYAPDVIVFGKKATLPGNPDQGFVMIKLLVEGELFDMEPKVIKN